MPSESKSPFARAATHDSSMENNPETWLDEHGDCLYGLALLRVRKPDVAEDMVQETLLAAIRSQNRFQGKSNIRNRH